MDNTIQKNRFAYLDNIRSLVVFLVLAMHSAVTYSGFGGWYYIEGSPEKLSVFEMFFFGLFQSFLQAWIMGALFFISAYLATKALEKRGSFNFLKERFFRLGLPLLVFMFIVSPFMLFIILGNYRENNIIENYIQFIKNLRWIGATGPLWYVQTLLIFCIFYVIFKKFSNIIKIIKINLFGIIFTIILTGIIAFFIRLVFPIGSSFYNLQFGYFSSYIVMFIAGIIVGENNLLDEITDEKNISWLKYSIIVGIPLWAIIMVFGGVQEGRMDFEGGFNWQSFAFSMWEALTAIGFSIGIIALFKKRINIDNKITGLIRDNSFGIYFFHAPVTVTISLILKNWMINPILKFLIVLILAFIATFIFSHWLRKIKPMRILFK
ncbi:MAG: acyltransferase [Treponema sp.]|nr:acyltransferase [Treponema sp.]